MAHACARSVREHVQRARLGGPDEQARVPVEIDLDLGDAPVIASAPASGHRDRILSRPVKVAIIGAGIAGLGAAHALVPGHDVTVFDAASRAGGHVCTVEADGHAVDLGFIVCNRERYPLLFRLFETLGVATRPTTMSFSVSIPKRGVEWGSRGLGAMFADRAQITDPRHWRFLASVARFVRQARLDLDQGVDGSCSLDDYLASRGHDAAVRDGFVVPLAAALWSLAPDRCGEFPATTFLRFLDQHGMLRLVRPLAWRTVIGGSARYTEALVGSLRDRGATLRLGTRVERVDRSSTGVTIHSDHGEDRVDRVIVATHADTALALLAAPTSPERRVLGAFRYSRNRTVLHRDPRFLPRRRAAHASWNYVEDPDSSRVSVTYSMSRLQGLPEDPPFLVTLNPRREPARALHEVVFDHPQLDRAALAAQGELAGLGRGQRTYYAGAHHGFGFHEDGLRSGLAAAAAAIADEVA